MTKLVPDDCLQLLAIAYREQPLRDGNVGISRTVAGRECVGILVGHDPNSWPRHAGRYGDLFDHVDQLALAVGLRIDDLARASRPENLFRAA